jgi:hypothetical protein
VLRLRAPRSGTSSCGGCATDTGDSGWEAADAESGDLEVIASAVLGRSGRDGLQRRVREGGHPPRRRLCCSSTASSLDKTWRGFGLGPITGCRERSAGCPAAAARWRSYPAMGEYPEGREQATEAYRRQAKEKIAALWESVGFQRFRRGVWLLDTALRQPEELIRARRAELHALSAAFHRSGPPENGPADGVTTRGPGLD